MDDSKAADSNQLVLVTGASGFIAGHVIKCCLESGYRVRGTVRSVSKPEKYTYLTDMGDVELVEADLTKDHGWDAAVLGVDHILHVASPFFVSGSEEELVRPAVDGTRRVLSAASREPNSSIQRVIVTSSVAAVSSGHQLENGHQFGPSDWSIVENCAPYPKSKTLAEKAVWEFRDNEECKFEIATVNPGFVMGPLLANKDCESATVVRRMFTDMPAVPNLAMTCVDVRDVALVHVRALTAPDVANKRLICSLKTMWFPDIADMLGERYNSQGYNVVKTRAPDWFVKFYATFDGQAAAIVSSLGEYQSFDNSETERICGLTLRDPTNAFFEMAQSQIDFGMIQKPESKCVVL